jgi:NAD-dependent dihydropyrimidine dehydrogenase PreA subunit
MRSDAIFIAVEVDDDTLAKHPELPAHLSQVCPVDIYREGEGGGLEIVAENVDECVLCGLCLAGSAGAVKVVKLYDDGAILQPAS